MEPSIIRKRLDRDIPNVPICSKVYAIEKLCCKPTEAGVFGADTSFNLCDLWITDTSYRNKHLVSAIDGGTSVHVGPIMSHLTKDKENLAGSDWKFYRQIRI